MRIRALITLALAFLSQIGSAAEHPQSVESLDKGIHLAASGGKLVLVQVSTPQCATCQSLEQAVPVQPGIALLLDQAYIWVRLNLEDLEQYGVRNRYQASRAPSFLILDSRGSMLWRTEEAISLDQLETWMKNYNQPRYRVREVSMERDYLLVDEQKNLSPSRQDRPGSLTLGPDNGPTGLEDPSAQPESLGIRVQAGIFSSRENAEQLAAQTSNLVRVPVFVESKRIGQRELFRVVLGPFPDVTEADRVRDSLHNNDIAAIVQEN